MLFTGVVQTSKEYKQAINSGMKAYRIIIKPLTFMKKVFLLALTVSLLTACDKGKSGTQIGQDVCDCSKKANAIDAADTKRTAAQDDCAKKQVEAWNKVKDDQKKADEFNKVLSDCASEQIKKAFGQ